MSINLNEKQAALLAKLRSGQARLKQPTASIPSALQTSELPISRAQRRIVFEELLYPGNTFNGTLTLEYAGELNVPALRAALDAIIERHAILRSNAFFSGKQWCARYNSHASIPLDVVDLSEIPTDEATKRLVELGCTQANCQIDIFGDPVLIRALLFKLADRRHVLTLTMHMYAFDAPSGAILVDELATIYQDLAAGRSISRAPLDYQYADYIAWEESTAPASDPASTQYWVRQLADLTSALELPTDKQRRPDPNFEAERFPFEIEPELAAGLKRLAKQQGVSFYVILLAAFACTLSRHTIQPNIPIGAWTIWRDARTQKLIGPFVNTVVYNLAVQQSETFVGLLERARAAARGVYAYGRVPFEDVVAALGFRRDSCVNPLFQVHFILQEVGPRNGVGGFSLSRFDALIGASGGYDIELVIRDLERGVEGHFECNASLFTATESTRLKERFLVVLAAVQEDPEIVIGSIPLGAASSCTEASLHSLTLPSICTLEWPLEHDRPALVTDSRIVTGQELDALVTAATYRLLEKLEPGAQIAIVPSSVAQTIVAILAAIRARMPFVVVDCAGNDPDMARAADAADVVVHAGDEELEFDVHHVVPRPLPESALIAYHAWSSGTGGERRQVPITRDRFARYLDAAGPVLGYGSGTVSMPFSEPWSDVFLEETLAVLKAGGRVVVGPSRSVASLSGLSSALHSSGATHLNLPSSFWEAWLRILLQRDESVPASLNTIIVGSEPVSLESVRDWRARFGDDVLLLHAYGVSECAVTSLTYRVPDLAAIGLQKRLPIGRPLPGQWVDVRDKLDQSVPQGVVGEIVVGFDGGSAPVRTGDLGRCRTDGEFEWLGRVDGREKRHGRWIDLARLDIALSAHPNITACNSALKRDGRPTICSTIDVKHDQLSWFESEASNGFADLKAFLCHHATDYVFPDVIILEGAPHSPILGRTADAATQKIIDLWAQVAGKEFPSSINLFEAGITSMDFMVFAALAEEKGLPLPMSDVYDLHTIDAQAAYLRQRQTD